MSLSKLHYSQASFSIIDSKLNEQFLNEAYMYVFCQQSQARKKADSDIEVNRPKFSLVNFHWQSRPVNSSDDTCQNSVQGRDILVDDKGPEVVSSLSVGQKIGFVCIL
jgi:hypothetical protein